MKITDIKTFDDAYNYQMKLFANSQPLGDTRKAFNKEYKGNVRKAIKGLKAFESSLKSSQQYV